MECASRTLTTTTESCPELVKAVAAGWLLLLHLLAFRRSFFRASAFFRQISLPSTVARRQSTPLNTSNMNGVNGINGHSNGHNGLNGYHHEDDEDEPITNGYCNGMNKPFLFISKLLKNLQK